MEIYSLEEKKAIKELTEIKELVEEDLKYKDYEVTATLDHIDLESLVMVLNLIEKQQKELMELSEWNKYYKKQIGYFNSKIKEILNLDENIEAEKGLKKVQELINQEKEKNRKDK